MQRSRTLQNSKGIALFEVLIAIAILASACILISRSIIGSFRVIHESQQYFEAQLIAESLLWNARHGLPLDQPETMVGADRLPQITLNQSSLMAWQGRLTQNQITLSWDHADKKTVALSSYLLINP